ncbi:methionyl-tRNA formyltransferase [Puniceibacterium sp. IMCC21224]|uniref:methionyl-tRNA formyltransferase n=1 Tax=Puniceibacterium sp. IMCC21224 TaxID=1618204 RepID=UPI00064DC56C|nr:methionyl-tRNA formyltransferase [Puniceibacterium sp. IMCC21224]KMK65859.1 methionyl-tRNA formyltransferase [Puniceibacterium sp. IMCC21224]
MRLIFMGTPEFSVPVLDALVAAGHEVAAVYCQPPRAAGRGKGLRRTPVHERALDLGLDVRHPVSLRVAEAQAEFAALDAEIAVVVAYGLILPQAVLAAPERGCLNIHASLLPRWRGAAPIHRAIMAGDEETGVCIMQMEAGLDTGPVLLSQSVAIAVAETTGTLHDRLSVMGARLIVDALDQLDVLEPQVQPESGMTYAAKIDKAEAKVDWTRSAVQVDRQIRGLAPFPGAWTMIAGERVKLLGSEPMHGSGTPGQLVDDGFAVACGEGAVRITRAQRAGRGAQDTTEFLRGLPLTAGGIIGG